MTGHTTRSAGFAYPIHIWHLNAIFKIALNVNSNSFTGIAHCIFFIRKYQYSTTRLIYFNSFLLVTTLNIDFAFAFVVFLAGCNGKFMFLGGQCTTISFGNPTLGCFGYFYLIIDIRLDFHLNATTCLVHFESTGSNQ